MAHPITYEHTLKRKIYFSIRLYEYRITVGVVGWLSIFYGFYSSCLKWINEIKFTFTPIKSVWYEIKLLLSQCAFSISPLYERKMIDTDTFIDVCSYNNSEWHNNYTYKMAKSDWSDIKYLADLDVRNKVLKFNKAW